MFEGVGHLPQLEIPDRFVDVVERWLAKTHGASRVPPSADPHARGVPAVAE
ncbi:MAG: hypothetical protein JST00_02065 [Deltaproteobacteria bacterium]|nr:hypothetical protein [Deltaproteobacteria bacterium]